jgi:NitT/TauT family transport system substrate-binding protein
MQIIQSRRDFLTCLSAAGAAATFGNSAALADEGPLETTTIRIRVEDTPPNVVNGIAENSVCNAPAYITDGLLRAEGFSDIHYILVKSGLPYTQAFERGDIDFALGFVPGALRRVDTGVPITVLAGVHPGCFALFAHDPIRTVIDLKGKGIGIHEAFGSADHLYVSIIAAHVGLDPQKDINWITTDDVADPMQLFVQREIEAYLAYVPEFPELRARKIGHVIVDMAMDQPWSQYFCCILVGHTDFVLQYPVATKRALRAILKATDLCATAPAQAARLLVEGGFALHYETALQTVTDLPYNVWRELDPEDSLRFYALWLHEFGMIDATPNKLIAEGTDWRFLNELKRALKA